MNQWKQISCRTYPSRNPTSHRTLKSPSHSASKHPTDRQTDIQNVRRNMKTLKLGNLKTSVALWKLVSNNSLLVSLHRPHAQMPRRISRAPAFAFAASIACTRLDGSPLAFDLPFVIKDLRGSHAHLKYRYPVPCHRSRYRYGQRYV
jgi:hypothetical protein